MKGQTPSRGARPHEGRRAWSRPFVPTLRTPQIECPGVCGDGARFRKAQWADERGGLKHRGGARKLAGVHGGTVRSARGRGKIRLRSRRIAQPCWIAQPCSTTVSAAMEQAATGGVACARSAGAVGGRPDRRHPQRSRDRQHPSDDGGEVGSSRSRWCWCSWPLRSVVPTGQCPPRYCRLGRTNSLRPRRCLCQRRLHRRPRRLPRSPRSHAPRRPMPPSTGMRSVASASEPFVSMRPPSGTTRPSIRSQ